MQAAFLHPLDELMDNLGQFRDGWREGDVEEFDIWAKLAGQLFALFNGNKNLNL
jgi:hypothetical protein